MGDAPSMSAASVRSRGIVCKPASIMTMLYPSQAHMIKRLREMRAHHTSSSQGMGDKLAYLRSTFNKPFCFSKRMRKANPAATIFVMKGRKIKVRKIRNPLTLPEFRMTARTSARNNITGTYRKKRMTPFVIDCQKTLSFKIKPKLTRPANSIGPTPFHLVKLKYNESSMGYRPKTANKM